MSNNPVGATLAVLSMLGFMAVVTLLGFTQYTIPTANRDFFLMGFGALISFATTSISYYIGSSKGSADKSDATAAAGAAKDSIITNLIAPGTIPPKVP